MYMLRIAGKTAIAIGLTFFVDTYGWPGGVKKSKFLFQNFFFNFFFYGQRRALQLVYTKGQYLMYLQNDKGCRYFNMYQKYRSEWKNLTG